MKTKLLIWIFAVLILSSFVRAELNDINLWVYWNMNETTGKLVSSTNNTIKTNISEQGTVPAQTGKISGSRGAYSAVNYFYDAIYPTYTGSQPISISLWVYPIATGADDWIAGIGRYATVANNFLYLNNSGSLVYQAGIGSNRDVLNSGTIPTNGSWTHVVGIFNTTHLFIYVNGVLKNSMAYTRGTGGASANTWIGREAADAGSVLSNTYVDEIGIWNRSLTSDEVLQLYNNASGKTFPFTTSSTPAVNYTLSAYDKKVGGGLTIQRFNATFNETTVYSTTTGTVTTGLLMNETRLFNITLRADGYRDLTLTNINLTSYYNDANMSSLFRAYANRTYWNTSISSFNITLNGSTFITTNTELNTTYAYDDGLFNITVNSAGYFPVTYTNWNLTNNLYANITSATTILNITAYSYSGAQLSNFIVTATSYNSSNISTGSTTGNQLSLSVLWNETYNVSIDVSGYALFNNYQNKTMTDYFNYVNFTNLYTTNAIELTFKDEITKALVYNVSFDLIGSLFNYNYTTNPNATKYIDLISPDTYTMRYTASGYPNQYYVFTLTNRSYNNLTLYLNNVGSNITVTVIDEIGNKVTDATIEVLKLESGSYFLSEMSAPTNIDGITYVHLTLGSQYYKFRVRKDGELKSILPDVITTTNPTYIYSNTLNIQIIEGEIAGTDYFNKEDIAYNFGFNYVTNNFRFEYSDLNSLATQACVYVDSSTGTQLVEDYNYSCLSGASGTILVGVAPINGTTYTARSYVYFGSEEQFIDTATATFEQTNNTGQFGLYLVFLLMIVFAFIGLWSPQISMIITPIPLVFASVSKMIAIPAPLTIGVWLLGIVFAVVISMRNE